MFQTLGLRRWLSLPEFNPQDPGRKNRMNWVWWVSAHTALCRRASQQGSRAHGTPGCVMPGKALDSPGPCLPPPWSGAHPPSPSLRALRITTPSGWQAVSGLGISCDRCESGVSRRTGLPTLPRASCLPALVPRLSHILTNRGPQGWPGSCSQRS